MGIITKNKYSKDGFCNRMDTTKYKLANGATDWTQQNTINRWNMCHEINQSEAHKKLRVE